MFRYSKTWLNQISKEPINHNELYDMIYDAGFEYGGIEKYEDDEIVEIEVKANRPDVLCQYGVLREYYAYKKWKCPKPIADLELINGKAEDLGLTVKVNQDLCKRMILLKIENVDNNKSTPDYIKTMLEKYKINSINSIVDIGNYLMLEMGQPFHIYDYDKLTNKNIIVDYSNNKTFKTLDNSEINLLNDTIMIKDNNIDICVAGIIGGKSAEVDKNTKNIIIESACFNDILIRRSAKKLKTPTLSSYRFERGIDPHNCLLGAKLVAGKIKELCGGNIVSKYYDSNPDIDLTRIEVSPKRINSILGMNIETNKMVEMLEQYYFRIIDKKEDKLIIEVPHFRLDIKIEEDIIEELARIYGYKNIPATLPNLTCEVNINEEYENMKRARNLYVGLGFYECINYGFIPSDSMEKLGIDVNSKHYSDIMLQNPLSNKYQLMRPVIFNGLVDSLTYNISKKTENLQLFEIGRVFYRDKGTDTGYNEYNSISCLINGIKTNKGFGMNNDIYYDYYDIANYLKLLMNSFGQKCDVIEKEIPFLTSECSGVIVVNDEEIGFIGKLKNDIILKYENGKLVTSDIFILELNLDKLNCSKNMIQRYKHYPSIERVYNLLVNNNCLYANYKKDIAEIDKRIYKINITDVYQGKGVPSDKKSILLKIEYNDKSRTLTAEEVTTIENHILDMLKQKYDIELKL